MVIMRKEQYDLMLKKAELILLNLKSVYVDSNNEVELKSSQFMELAEYVHLMMRFAKNEAENREKNHQLNEILKGWLRET